MFNKTLAGLLALAMLAAAMPTALDSTTKRVASLEDRAPADPLPLLPGLLPPIGTAVVGIGEALGGTGPGGSSGDCGNSGGGSGSSGGSGGSGTGGGGSGGGSGGNHGGGSGSGNGGGGSTGGGGSDGGGGSGNGGGSGSGGGSTGNGGGGSTGNGGSGGSGGPGSCSTYCCNSVQTAPHNATANEYGLVNLDIQSINIGLTCDPIAILGTATTSCGPQQAACCAGKSYDSSTFENVVLDCSAM